MIVFGSRTSPFSPPVIFGWPLCIVRFPSDNEEDDDEVVEVDSVVSEEYEDDFEEVQDRLSPLPSNTTRRKSRGGNKGNKDEESNNKDKGSGSKDVKDGSSNTITKDSKSKNDSNIKKNKNKSRPRYCLCVIDGVRDEADAAISTENIIVYSKLKLYNKELLLFVSFVLV